MRQYPRRIYKGNESKNVTNEAEEIQAGKDGWNCARNKEKIALKEKAGKGILKEKKEVIKPALKEKPEKGK